MKLSDLTQKQILEAVKNNEIKSENFETFEEYLLCIYGFEDILEENKRRKEVEKKIRNFIDNILDKEYFYYLNEILDETKVENRK